MNGDTPISGKSMVGESVVEASRKWVGEVFQDGRIKNSTCCHQSSETKNPNIGCGLGLAIAKKIADLHDAFISFNSADGINSVEVKFSTSFIQ
jgi:light-regulated signal transduction histidine kinase (bacteriophytochrome)